jgi:hypothetical protein
MAPKELHIYDFDETLYRSPTPPPGASMAWYFHAHSLGKPEAPGFDGRWVLPVLIEARRSSMDPRVASVLLTARPDHAAMRSTIYRTLALADVRWDAVQLRPIMFPGNDAMYKATVVQEWLMGMPTVEKVVFWDDQDENLELVGRAVRNEGRRYMPRLSTDYH